MIEDLEWQRKYWERLIRLPDLRRVFACNNRLRWKNQGIHAKHRRGLRQPLSQVCARRKKPHVFSQT